MVYLSVIISYLSTQFEELHGPFINLGAIYPQKIILPKRDCSVTLHSSAFHGKFIGFSSYSISQIQLGPRYHVIRYFPTSYIRSMKIYMSNYISPLKVLYKSSMTLNKCIHDRPQKVLKCILLDLFSNFHYLLHVSIK